MALIRWDPFRNISTLQDRINRLFDDAFPGRPEGDENLALSAWRPQVDIYETEDGVVIHVDLPGVEKSAVSVEVKDNVLTIRGDRKSDATVDENSYYRRERSFGIFQRSFTMRSVIAPDRIKASFKNGVLTIRLPRIEEERPKQISVDIE